jgi:hypothetical protein
MAWLVADGFDYYGTVGDLARSVWDNVVITGVTLDSLTRFGVGQSWKVTTSNLPSLLKNTTNETTFVIAVAYYWPAALGGTNPALTLVFRDAGTAQCTVCFESGGNITLKSGTQTGTVLATYPAAIPQAQWTHFQLKVVINATTGALTIRKNGSPSDSFAATGLNTRGGTANNYANSVLVQSGTTFTAGNEWYIDDLFVCSGSGAVPNDWTGDIRALVLMPSGDTGQKQFGVFPGASPTNASAVDELFGNADTDYVFDSTVGHEDLYTLADLPVTPAAIIGVVSKVCIKKSDAGARSGQLRVLSGGTEVGGVDTVLGSTYSYLSRVDVVDPATGVAWTPAAVNALQVGQKVTA